MKRMACAAMAVALCLSSGDVLARTSKTELKRQLASLELREERLRTQVASLRAEVIKGKSAPSLTETTKIPIVLYSLGFHDVDITERINTTIPDPVLTLGDALTFWNKAKVVYRSGMRHNCFPWELDAILKDTADHFNTTVYVFSGHRDHKHNARVGGASRSQHLVCKAADFSVTGVAYDKAAAYLWRHKYVKGLGLYRRRFFHADVRQNRIVWSQFAANESRSLIGAGPLVHIAGYGRRSSGPRYARHHRHARYARA